MITRREQVASIRGKAIYAVRDVTLIPLTSQDEAQKSIAAVRKSLAKAAGAANGGETDESHGGDDDDTHSIASAKDEKEHEDPAAIDPPKDEPKQENAQSRGGYGGFAKRWFSNKAGSRGKQELTSGEDSGQEQKPAVERAKDDVKGGTATTIDSKEPDDQADPDDKASPDDTNKDQKASSGKSTIESLTPRILRNAKLYFSTSGLFYSHDHDLSGTLTQRSTLTSDLPLWKRFDALVRQCTVPDRSSANDFAVLLEQALDRSIDLCRV